MFLDAKVGIIIYIASDLSKTLSLFNNKSRATYFLMIFTESLLRFLATYGD